MLSLLKRAWQFFANAIQPLTTAIQTQWFNFINFFKPKSTAKQEKPAAQTNAVEDNPITAQSATVVTALLANETVVLQSQDHDEVGPLTDQQTPPLLDSRGSVDLTPDAQNASDDAQSLTTANTVGTEEEINRPVPVAPSMTQLVITLTVMAAFYVALFGRLSPQNATNTTQITPQ